jgi:NhaP-type Na+/H+ or K+/H+ antiporter
VGCLVTLWLRKIVKDDIVTCMLTLISCYMSFYFAEFTFLRVSGILSVLVLGIFIGHLSKYNISPESNKNL